MSVPQPSVESRMIGRWRVHALQAGGQQLDGGAMFGVVPKPLWERRVPADGRNRIQLGMRCLLIEHDSGLVLIDTGAGNKENAKFHEIYGLENGGADALTLLEDALATLGFAPRDIRFVINTHLHFDHAGGNTRIDTAGEVHVSFPEATYYVQRGELEYATHTNERTAASYFARNWDVIASSGRMQLLDGEPEIVAGIHALRTPGHVPHHQSIVIDGGNGDIACFLGDACPTTAHLPLPWIMGYDVEPLVSLETKRSLLRRVVEERWLVIFEHDALTSWGHVEHDGKIYRMIDEGARPIV